MRSPLPCPPGSWSVLEAGGALGGGAGGGAPSLPGPSLQNSADKQSKLGIKTSLVPTSRQAVFQTCRKHACCLKPQTSQPENSARSPSRDEGAWMGSRAPANTTLQLPCLDLPPAPEKTGAGTEPYHGASPAAPGHAAGVGSPVTICEGDVGRKHPPDSPLPAQRKAWWAQGNDSHPQALAGTQCGADCGDPSSLSSNPRLP